MQRITSKDNSLVKHIKKLKDKKERDKSGEYIIDGIKLIKEALNENVKIKQIVVCEDSNKLEVIEKSLKYELAKQECIYVPENIFNLISDVENPQGILAVVEKENIEKKIDYSEDIIVALDDIQDPGNLGTILRTADSVGLKQILVSKGTADAFNPKVVRSTMGAIFRVKVIECENLKKTLEEVKKHKFDILVTELGATDSIYDIDMKKKVIVIGNEANGVSEEIKNVANKKVIIPMLGKTESLNASIATGVILYEYVRQKIKNG